ncbi:hypothetical protein HMY34_09630 [Thiothrix subterranea]|uniref:hypothetical protein n=1 Tax=Thiothrix subterranea TaxID=2735563 RepID=UPI00192A8091|nr:hypothetical protein [Thiothrix subterranea]QQZ28993.1 hypothetical protein HMY34_09630 [Thiothrix subterranea]
MYKHIDKSDPFDTSTTSYWVYFVARDYIPGHAFVMWNSQNNNTGSLRNDHSFGIYPDLDNNVKILFGTVTGKLIQESSSSLLSADNGIAVKVSKKIYDYTWSNSENIRKQVVSYNLFNQSCVDFVDLTAKAIGLKTPDSEGFYNHPQLFINRIQEIND